MADALQRRLVAIMFTDMVGYTAMMQTDEPVAIARRDAYVEALNAAHAEYGGTIVQRLGDGSMSMFDGASAAVRAGIAMQQSLRPREVDVRIGIHVGEVIVEPERLTGAAVNIAARIESFAVGGAVLLSDSAREQVDNHPDIPVVGLGQFKLKNVGRPFDLFAVAVDGLAIPDARDLEGKGERILGLPTNLVEPKSTILGRASDLAEIQELIRSHRVVTITGPGGVGKTTLMQALGRMVAADFEGGVSFVSLIDVETPSQFAPALAEAFDVKEAEERTFAQGIAALIGGSSCLLLLDNFEQIVDAASQVAWLVDACPGLRVVITSRTALRIGAEAEYQLHPLLVPDEQRALTVDEILEVPAVALFVERARQSKAGFALTASNAASIAAICRRLDGLPLALELAAARLRLLSPEALLERLDHALDVLTSGPRDSHSRQQTLRATIDWSHSLLTPSEQVLFRRFAAFSGGCTIDDLQAICAEPGSDVLDDLQSLVEKALINVDPQTSRLRMLQTIVDFAGERLAESGDEATIRDRHAHRFAIVAAELRDGVEGGDQLRALDRGIAEEANLVATLEHLLSLARQGDAAAREIGMQMTGDLMMYWHLRGKNLSARDYAQAFVATDDERTPTIGRVGALTTAGLASWMLGRLDQANAEWAEAYAIAATLNSPRNLCAVSATKGLGFLGVDVQAGLDTTAESMERCAAAALPWWGTFAATLNGMFLAAAGELDAAEARCREALAVQERLGDAEGTGLSTSALAAFAVARGDLPAALEWYRKSLAAFEACRDRAEEARVLAELAWTHLDNGDRNLARWYFFESAQAYLDVASVRGVGLSLVGLAATESFVGRHHNAVVLASAAEVYAQEEGIVNVYSAETSGERHVADARSALSSEEVAAAEALGKRMSASEALNFARELHDVQVH